MEVVIRPTQIKPEVKLKLKESQPVPRVWWDYKLMYLLSGGNVACPDCVDEGISHKGVVGILTTVVRDVSKLCQFCGPTVDLLGDI